MSADDLGFIHRFEAGGDSRALLLLHGTGGNEDDLIALGQAVAPGWPLLSPRGKVLENGMPRFFRRLSEGVFDEADVRARAAELADFVIAASSHYGIDPSRLVALGYSNGANIASAMLLLRPEAVGGAVLLRPMMPFAEPPAAHLADKAVLMLAGQFDPVAPPDHALRLEAVLAKGGAAVQRQTLPASHGLTNADVDLVQAWLAARPQ